jgi:hypothetical protein
VLCSYFAVVSFVELEGIELGDEDGMEEIGIGCLMIPLVYLFFPSLFGVMAEINAIEMFID